MARRENVCRPQRFCPSVRPLGTVGSGGEEGKTARMNDKGKRQKVCCKRPEALAKAAWLRAPNHSVRAVRQLSLTACQSWCMILRLWQLMVSPSSCKANKEGSE